MRRTRVAAGLALSILMAACSLQVDERDFAPSIDADVSDSAPAGVQLDPALLDVVEGESGTLTVRATAALSGDVTIALSTDATLGLSVTEVVLSPSQPETTVMVTALDDDDAQPASATVTAQAPSLGIATSQVAIAEDDELLIEVDQSAVTLTETSTQQVQVRLMALPPGDLTVTVASGDTAIASVAPASLFFGAANWNVYQPVTIAGSHDLDAEGDIVAISLSSTGLPTVNVTATVNDVDRLAIETSLTSGALTVTEQGPPGVVGVRLNQQPSGTVVVTAAPGSAGIQVSPSSVMFTPQDFNTFKNLSITGVMDDDTDDLTTSVNLSATDLDTLPFTVVVDDDDLQTITEDAPSPLVLDEGEQVTFLARLSHRPANNVVVGVTSTNAAAATVSPGALTFTTTDWNIGKPVTVTGVDDQNVALGTTTIRMQAGTLITDVATEVVDLDIQAIVLANQPTVVTEGGTAGFTVALAYEPAASTMVAIGSSDAAISVSPPTLTFTATNYATPQPVTLTAPSDIDVIEESAIISVTSPPLTPRTFSVTVDETSVINILPSVSSLMVTEQAAGVPFTVTLSNPPVGSMTVSISSNSPGVSVNPTSLVFNAGDFGSPKTVTVSGLLDDDVADLPAVLTLSAPGATSGTVSVTVDDDDTQAILEDAPSTVDVIDPNGTGAGAGVGFGVRLAFRPATNVTVNVTSLVTGTATVSPGSLTFTTADWNLDKTVTVTAASDLNMVDGATSVRLASTGLLNVDVAVAVDDQDVQVVEANAGSLTITEGTSMNLGVRLRYQPASASTVTLSSSSGEVTVPSTLSFTTANYNSYQNAAVAAAVDSDQTSETATLTLGNLDAPSNTTVGVTVTDTTIVNHYGYPTPLNGTDGVINFGQVVAFRVPQTMSGTETVHRIGLVAGGAGEVRLAIYSDVGNLPSTLRFEIARTSVTAGLREFLVSGPMLGSGNYWIAIRSGSPNLAVDQAPAGTIPLQRVCNRSVSINNLDTNWPTSFGGANCADVLQHNLFFSTNHQP